MSLPQLNAPALPPAEVQHGDVMTLPPLYVVTVISNPARWNSRTQLYTEFAKRVTDAGGILHTVEIAYGDRPFAVTEAGNPRHLRLRTNDELWHKENMVNLGVQHLPPEADYIAWIDADVTFTNPHWVNETIQQLQTYKMVQMFTHAIDQGPNYQPFATHRGFVYGYMQDPSKDPRAGPGTPAMQSGEYGGGTAASIPGINGSLYHPGYAWASRRATLDQLGGLIDWAIVGEADYQMARALVGKVGGAIHNKTTPQYHAAAYAWQERAAAVVNQSIGYVETSIVHYWHGKKANRKYWDRNSILIDSKYNPYTDIHRNSHGVYQLTSAKRQLRDDLRGYFRQRNEDSIDL